MEARFIIKFNKKSTCTEGFIEYSQVYLLQIIFLYYLKINCILHLHKLYHKFLWEFFLFQTMKNKQEGSFYC